MRFVFSIFFLFISLALHAQEADCEDGTPKELKPIMEVAAAADETPACPNRKKFKNLCSMVGSRVPDEQDPKKYMYKRRIMEAACVDTEKDSEAVQHEKIRNAWATYEADLKCNNTQFDVTDGHLLKYAVTTYFDDFIEDVIKWKVNLNKVDASDGRTVLDYIKSQMDRNKGNPLEPKFKKYYDRLRSAGAKHKTEL